MLSGTWEDCKGVLRIEENEERFSWEEPYCSIAGTLRYENAMYRFVPDNQNQCERPPWWMFTEQSNAQHKISIDGGRVTLIPEFGAPISGRTVHQFTQEIHKEQ